MKVLYDFQIFSSQKYGGISRCFVELYKHLPKEVEAEISVHESDNVYIKDLFDEVKPTGDLFDHFICNRNFRGKVRLHMLYDRLTRGGYYPDYNENYSISLLRRGEFDIFHPTYFSDYFLPYLNGKPFVLTIHDMIPERYPQYFDRDDFQIIMKKKLAPLASAIIVVSECTKKDVVKLLGVPEDKVHVVYHGCSFPFVEGKALYSFSYILFVGERGLYKNFLPFVKAIIPVLNRHKDLHVVCTGKVFSKDEMGFLEGFGVSDRFHHHWVKTDRDFFSLYHYAQCFVYPSEYEGFGIPILEAYQAECPVLLNHASCFPEIAGDAAIYFNMNSKNKNLEEQTELLLSLTIEERNNLITKQKDRLTKYSWEESAKQMVTIYQSLT